MITLPSVFGDKPCICNIAKMEFHANTVASILSGKDSEKGGRGDKTTMADAIYMGIISFWKAFGWLLFYIRANICTIIINHNGMMK